MKKLYTLFLLAFSAVCLQAQTPVAKVGFAAGGDIEMPHGLSHQHLFSTAENMDFNYQDLPFDHGEMTKMQCDNGTFRMGIAVMPPKWKNAELQITLLQIEGRIDRMEYDNPETGEFLNVQATNKEWALETVFLPGTRAAKWLSMYGGFGTNIGYSYDGKVELEGFLQQELVPDPARPNDVPLPAGENVSRTYEQRNSINQRFFLQAGVGFHFLKRMEFGLECRKGLGYRASLGGPFTFTTLKRSLGFSLKYTLY